MEKLMRAPTLPTLLLSVPLASCAALACAQGSEVRTGATAINDDLKSDAPGVRRHIKPSDLPAPPKQVGDPEASVAANVKVVAPPQGAAPKVPDGFAVQVFASGFKQPRTIRVAPNGDVFLSESGTGRVLVFGAPSGSAAAGGTSEKPEVFAQNLERPYGIAFVPPENPQYDYVAAANQVELDPYRDGEVKAAGPAEVVVDNIPTKRHWTRDLAVSRDGKRLFLAVGSGSNLGGDMDMSMSREKIRQLEKSHGRGAAWGPEENRAVVRVFDPEGNRIRNYATGLRNCSGLALQPGTDNLWCVVNERDHLGPNLVPDFVAQIKDGAFYGWPWYYVGSHEDPAYKGKRPDLRGHVQAPEVLFQAHSSALSVAFYDGEAFPAEYRGDAFVALHGSHSRPARTGYKVGRVRMQDGKPTGEYQDFMTGFEIDGDTVWARPAGVAVTKDGELLVSDDANGTIFRVAASGR
jgi:glucose/arabinose dehydrogenase